MKAHLASLARGASIMTAALLLSAASSTADTPCHGEGHVMLTPDELEWGPIGSMAPPAQIAVIEGKLAEAEPFTFRLKLPAGYDVLPTSIPHMSGSR